jgi:hypothetical protein
VNIGDPASLVRTHVTIKQMRDFIALNIPCSCPTVIHDQPGQRRQFEMFVLCDRCVLIGKRFGMPDEITEDEVDAIRLNWVEENLCRTGDLVDNAGSVTGKIRAWVVSTQINDDSLRQTIDTLRKKMDDDE